MAGTEAVVPGASPAKAWFRRFLNGESFYPLFVLLLVSLAFIIGGGDRRWAVTLGHVLAAGSLLLAVRPARAARVWWAFGGIALALGIAAAMLQALTEANALRAVAAVVFLVVIFASLPLILRRLVSHREVTAETIVGALCAYLLIGMDFAVLNALFSAVEGQAIVASLVAPEATVTRGDLYYHSFMTLTTVGYGDFIPVSGSAKTLALLEGILGQLFLVTVVARLVSVATLRRTSATAKEDVDSDADTKQS